MTEGFFDQNEMQTAIGELQSDSDIFASPVRKSARKRKLDKNVIGGIDISDLNEKEQQRLIDSRILQVLDISDFEDDDDLYEKRGPSLPSTSELPNTSNKQITEIPLLPGMYKLSKTGYLTTKEMIDKMLTPGTEILDSVPVGYKMNAYCFVRRNDRFSRTNKELVNDDAGFWRAGSINVQSHIVHDNGEFKFIVKHGGHEGVYCTRNSRRHEYTPMKPQPDETNLLVIMRMYQKLDSDHERVRRLSKFTQIPTKFASALQTVSECIIYEYAYKSF